MTQTLAQTNARIDHHRQEIAALRTSYQRIIGARGITTVRMSTKARAIIDRLHWHNTRLQSLLKQRKALMGGTVPTRRHTVRPMPAIAASIARRRPPVAPQLGETPPAHIVAAHAAMQPDGTALGFHEYDEAALREAATRLTWRDHDNAATRLAIAKGETVKTLPSPPITDADLASLPRRAMLSAVLQRWRAKQERA